MTSLATLRRPAPALRPADVRLVPVGSPAEWDGLVADHGGVFFHRHAFLSTLAAGLGLALDLRAVEIRGERVGAVPIVSKRLGPLRTVNWLPFPYIGPLVAPGALPATLAALVRCEARMRCLRSQHVLLARHPGPHPGYVASEDRTFVVPVAGRTDDELLQAMNSARRSSIRRAGRQGLRLRAATETEVTRLLPELLAPTFEQQGLPSPYPSSVMRTVWDRLGGHPDVLMQAAELDGATVAVQISLAGGATSLGWVVGRVPGNEGSDAFATMILHTLGWVRDRGSTGYDLVGAPTEGIAAYKRSLGAEERHYTVLRRRSRTHRTAVSLLNHLPGHHLD